MGTVPRANASAAPASPMIATSAAATPMAMTTALASAEKVSVTLRRRLDTTAPVATNPSTETLTSIRPGRPSTSQPSRPVPSEEPIHASPNAMRGKPGPATTDRGGGASLMAPWSLAAPSLQLNSAPWTSGNRRGPRWGHGERPAIPTAASTSSGERPAPAGQQFVQQRLGLRRHPRGRAVQAGPGPDLAGRGVQQVLLARGVRGGQQVPPEQFVVGGDPQPGAHRVHRAAWVPGRQPQLAQPVRGVGDPRGHLVFQ